MKSSRGIFFIMLAMSMWVTAYTQSLHKVCPVSLSKGNAPDSISFLLTTADFNYFQGKPIKYAPSIEIVDADAPWPPRWYALHPEDTSVDLSSSRWIMLNASQHGDKFLYFTVTETAPNIHNLAIPICDKTMNRIGTFYRQGKEIDSHDFKLSPNGDMMYLLTHDTIVDLRKVYNNKTDSAVRMIYESIEIVDIKGKSLFSWDPVAVLGFDAVYLPYRYAPGVMSGYQSFEWSHGNSLQYDYDGNILYSFKHIGIGKISRTDGHVIWHIDRNKQKINDRSDAIPIYLQHDFQMVKDEQGNISYTILSNGDDEHPECIVYQFTVNYDAKGTPIIKLLKKISPSEKTPNTGGGGNFDMDENGNYLFNYGLFKQDTALRQRTLFEYKDKQNNRATEYTIAPTVFSYRIHKMTGTLPVRPVITARGQQLCSDKKEVGQKWYRLSGHDMHTVDYVGTGEKFSPKEDGYYCVSTPYGIGWTVSRPYKFTKK